MEFNEPDTTSATIGAFSPAGKKRRWPLVGSMVVVAIVAVAAVLFVMNRNNQSSAISPKVANVVVQPAGFLPGTIQIQKGQEITFTNQDASAHHITANQTDLPDFDTVQPLQTGDTYTYIFDKAGTFHYYDTANAQKFVGTIIVK